MKIIYLFAILLLNIMAANAQRIGVVLSGGGARALSQIGVLKALEENEIPIDYITGNSMGALVGSLYACGLSPGQMEAFAVSPDFAQRSYSYMNDKDKWFFLSPNPDAGWVSLKMAFDSILQLRLPGSVNSTTQLDWTLMNNLSAANAVAGYNFDNLLVPFRCLAADIKAKEQVVFSSGDLPQAIRASMAFPFYYPPLSTQNRIMFDGGIYNNFPVDLMEKHFKPDIIIGINAGDQTEIVFDDNILSQVKTMLVQQQNDSLHNANDILLIPPVAQYGVFDFEKAGAAIDSGYNYTMRMMPLIKSRIERRMPDEELQKKRADFFGRMVTIKVDKIIVQGVSESQVKYVQHIIKPDREPQYLFMLKPDFFRLSADANIKWINPRLILNKETGYYDMLLEVKREKDLQIDLGGNFSSRPINMGYVGIRKNWLGSQSYSLSANTYFGKLYNSAHVDLRLDIPGKTLYFIQPEFNINKFDYFKSSSAFFEDVKPSYLVQNDNRFALNAGIPAGRKGKLIATGALYSIVNKYYQSQDFTQADTSDRTVFEGYTAGLTFERNTYNYRMYANKGSYFNITARTVEGYEETTPGSTSQNRDTVEDYHHWLQLKAIWDNYFARLGPVRFGLYTELNFSSQDFFSNYTASVLMAPAFSPTPESQTLFLEKFRAYNYFGLGFKTVWQIINNLQLRGEIYMYQPFNEILQAEDGNYATFGEPLSKRYFIANANAVYHTPLGPVSLSFNYYYDKFDEPYSIMFHFGYILFNKSTLN